MQRTLSLSHEYLPHIAPICEQLGTEPQHAETRATYKRIAFRKNGSQGIDTKVEIYTEYCGSSLIEINDMDKKMSAPPKAELQDAFLPLALHYCVAMCKINQRYYSSLNRTHFEYSETMPSVFCGVEQKEHGEQEAETFSNCHVLGLQFKGDEIIIEVLWGDLSNQKEVVGKSAPISDTYPYYDDLKLTCERIVMLAHKYNFMGDYELAGVEKLIYTPNEEED